MMLGVMRYHDLERHRLFAGCIMPNHLHAVVKPFLGLQKTMHSWKSYSSNQANRILVRKGRFWQREYFDRMICGVEDFYYYVDYTIKNPVTAGLVRDWRDWPWTWVSPDALPPKLPFE